MKKPTSSAPEPPATGGFERPGPALPGEKSTSNASSEPTAMPSAGQWLTMASMPGRRSREGHWG